MNSNNEEIIQRLDIMIMLLIPSFEESKYPVKGLAVEILRLCDSQHSTQEIVKKLKKSRKIVDNALVKLRSLNLVKSINKGSGTYHMRLK